MESPEKGKHQRSRSRPSSRTRIGMTVRSSSARKSDHNNGKEDSQSKTNIPNEMGKDGKVVKKRKKKGNKPSAKTVSQEENVVIVENTGKATQCSTIKSALGPKEKEKDISRAAFSQLDIPAAGKVRADTGSYCSHLPELARRPIHPPEQFSGLQHDIIKTETRSIQRTECQVNQSKEKSSMYGSAPELLSNDSEDENYLAAITVTPTDMRFGLLLVFIVLLFCCLCLHAERYDIFVSNLQTYISNLKATKEL